MIKQLILLRHAHRDTTERSLDNGLSPKGQRQAKWIKRFASQRFDSQEWQELRGVVVSSPKRRCIETVEPLADLFQGKVEIRQELDEQRSGESFAAFDERIHRFMSWWVREAPPLVVACSHGDWLPLAIFHVSGSALEMKKGSWVELEWESNRAQLRWYLPSFKSFYGGA
ncbi:MAG: histidine phosphatase family protein [Bdellovibrionales bacterium]